MEQSIERLSKLAGKKERFTYDLRGDCQVYSGVVAAYRIPQDNEHALDLEAVITHAMDHDGIVGGWKDPNDGQIHFYSGRIFTDTDHALRFAADEEQPSVYNLNREEEVQVTQRSTAA